ncbi:MAG: hypothetical protein AAFX93_03460 [Verrucomicrobiota bacterium]
MLSSKIHSQIDIPLPPSDIWSTLEYPELMELWNPHCKNAQALGRPMRKGDRFNASFELNSKPTEAQCEVLEMDAMKLLVVRHHIVSEKKTYIDERYELKPLNKESTRVSQSIELNHSGMPKWVLLIIALIHRFGTPQNKGPLDGLKEVTIAHKDMGWDGHG